MFVMPRFATSAKLALYALLITALFLAVACGGAAKPAAPAAAPQKEAPAAKATPVPAAAAAPTPTPAPAFSPGKVTLMTADFGTQAFDPRDATGQVMTYLRALHGWLIAGTKDAQMIPGIAKKWEISSDGLKWTWTIGKGAKFHNGDEITIDDVLFTLTHYHGPEAATGAVHTQFQAQSKITVSQEKAGPDTIVVTQKQPTAFYPFFLSELHSSDGHGAVLSKKHWEQVGGKAGYEKNPLGAGPFKFVSFKPSEQMLFERFDDYYFQPKNGFPEDRRVKFQTLDMRLVQEQSTRVSALRAGQADMIDTTLQAKNQIESSGGRLIFIPEAAYTQIRPLGCWKPQFPCNKKQVRYALDYAINKELIRDTLYGGREAAQLVGLEHVTPNALGYSRDLDALPYDPEKAKQLLAEAGYPGGKGYPPFKIYTWQASDVPLLPELAQLLADMWRKNLGLQVEVEVGDTVGIRQRVQDRQLDGNVQLRSNEGRWDGGSLMRSAHYLTSPLRQSEDPELQKAVDEALAVLDPAKRQEAYNKALKKSWEEHYMWGAVYVNLPWGVNQRVATWEPWPLGPYASALWTVTLKK